MKTLTKLAGIVMMALAIPLFATAASAAEVRMPDAGMTALNGAAKPAPALLAKRVEPERIQVAGRRGARIGAAIVGGIVAGALIAGAARAHNRRKHRYYRHRHVNRCDRWLWDCDHGYRRACRKFYRYCD